MLPKAPKISMGRDGIEAYRANLRDYALSLRNRMNREFYRKNLATRASYYGTLADQKPSGSDAARHFAELARLHADELEAFGPEPPPKLWQGNLATIPLTYPELPDEFTHRVHFLVNGSLRRERSAALATYADAVSHQIAANGDVLLSVAVHPDRAQFFERLIESTGAEGLGPRLGEGGGFCGYIASDGRPVKNPGWEDVDSPWRRIREENFRASLYHWSLRRGHLDPSIVLPKDLPDIPKSLPWDPDARFNHILALTQADRLAEAMDLVEKIPASDREIIFDEVLYLRYLIGQSPTGDDLRYLARKYIAGSSIRARLEEEFEAFIACLNEALADSGPIPDDFPGLSSLADILEHAPDLLKRDTPPLKDWSATRTHYYRQYEAYGQPVKPRGRIFIWHPDIASSSLNWIKHAFRPEFIEAENNFRRTRSIAEIGRGWASETALFDLVRSIYSDAVHQWRPPFLGFQSVDIYIPSMNLAIEYQGEQHYRPVQVFGGEDGFAATKARDARKRAVLESHHVGLLEWQYDRAISRAEVKAALASFCRAPSTARGLRPERPQLPEHMQHIVRELAADESVLEIWLIGSRANGTATAESDWDILVRATREPHCTHPRSTDVDILWSGPSGTTLLEGQPTLHAFPFTDFRWTDGKDGTATYLGRRFLELTAEPRDASKSPQTRPVEQAIRLWYATDPHRHANADRNAG